MSHLGGRAPQSEPPPPAKMDVVFETAIDVAWRKLQARAGEVKTKPDARRADLLAFRQKFPGSVQATQATAFLAAMPSALDRIDDARLIPKAQRFAWQPLELIAILGDRWDKKSRMPLAVSFSPDGKYLATGSEDNNARVWDTAQLPKLTVLSEHTSRVHSVAFSPDGQVLATGGGDGAIVLWDNQGKMLRRLDAHQAGVMALAFSPAGRTLASAGGDGRVVLWSDPVASTDALVLEGGAGRILCVNFSPDATTLIAGGTGNSLRWWKLNAAEPVAKGSLALPTGWAKVAAFSPDGKSLVCGGGGNGTLYLCAWQDDGPKVRAVLDKHQQRVNDITFAPDGKTFASGSEDASVKLWETATGKVVKDWSDLRFPVNGVSFAPDGRHLAVANGNSTVYLLRLGRTDSLAAGK
jgi:WD40 repeat protein